MGCRATTLREWAAAARGVRGALGSAGRPPEHRRIERSDTTRKECSMAESKREEAARKGGEAVSRDREHMAEIGKRGAEARVEEREQRSEAGRMGAEAREERREERSEAGRAGA